jgi:Arm DNA-binding domain
LDVQKTGAAQWNFRYPFAGKRRDMGLGRARGLDAVSLARARLLAADNRTLIRAGIDPLERRKGVKAAQGAEIAAEAKTKVTTFSQAVEKFLEGREAGSKNPKHRAQWRMTLTEYAGKKLDKKPVADITTADVLDVLKPLWLKIPETASRLRARMEAYSITLPSWAACRGKSGSLAWPPQQGSPRRRKRAARKAPRRAALDRPPGVHGRPTGAGSDCSPRG